MTIPTLRTIVNNYALSGYIHYRDDRCTHLAKRVCGSGVDSSYHCYD